MELAAPFGSGVWCVCNFSMNLPAHGDGAMFHSSCNGLFKTTDVAPAQPEGVSSWPAWRQLEDELFGDLDDSVSASLMS